MDAGPGLRVFRRLRGHHVVGFHEEGKVLCAETHEEPEIDETVGTEDFKGLDLQDDGTLVQLVEVESVANIVVPAVQSSVAISIGNSDQLAESLKDAVQLQAFVESVEGALSDSMAEVAAEQARPSVILRYEFLSTGEDYRHRRRRIRHLRLLVSRHMRSWVFARYRLCASAVDNPESSDLCEGVKATGRQLRSARRAQVDGASAMSVEFEVSLDEASITQNLNANRTGVDASMEIMLTEAVAIMEPSVLGESLSENLQQNMEGMDLQVLSTRCCESAHVAFRLSGRSHLGLRAGCSGISAGSGGPGGRGTRRGRGGHAGVLLLRRRVVHRRYAL